MKRFMTLVGVAVVAAAMYVAAASGSQQARRGPTAKQFAALKKQVNGLSKKVKALNSVSNAMLGLLISCDQGAAPIDQVGDPAGTFGYKYQAAGTQTLSNTTALNVVDPNSDANAVYITFGDSTCAQQFGGLRHAAAKAGLRLPQAARPAWAAHQR
jgi:hypothetical protein